MKNTAFLLLALISFGKAQAQQSTAMDFARNDCYGNFHHLFSTLDSNYTVILEYVMDCSTCINAGHKLETMQADLNAEFPGMIRFYQLAYTNSYSCNMMTDFVEDNNFNTVPFDSGAAQVAYYGGFGMPTVVVVAGPGHQVLFTGIGFTTSDTTQIGAAVRAYYSTSTNENIPDLNSINLFPNPAFNLTNVALNLKENVQLTLELLDISGRSVSIVFNGNATAGWSNYSIDANEISSGVYLLRAVINGRTIYRKINII